MRDIDWGDAPTWIAAVFAGLAALAAGLTLRSQRKQIEEQRRFIGEQSTNLELERAELRAQAEERRRQQAQQVRMKIRLQAMGGGMHGESTEMWIVEASNRSSEPLRELAIQCGDSVQAVRAVTAVGPSEVPVSIIGAREDVRFETAGHEPGELRSKRPVLRFTDNAGVRWRLDEHSDLSEVPPEPAS